MYVFFKNGRKIVISPIKENSVLKASKVEGKSSLLLVNNEDTFNKKVRESKQVFAIVVTNRGPKTVPEILVAM